MYSELMNVIKKSVSKGMILPFIDKVKKDIDNYYYIVTLKNINSMELINEEQYLKKFCEELKQQLDNVVTSSSDGEMLNGLCGAYNSFRDIAYHNNIIDHFNMLKEDFYRNILSTFK